MDSLDITTNMKNSKAFEGGGYGGVEMRMIPMGDAY